MKCEAGGIAVVISNRFSGNIGTFVRLTEAVDFPGFGVFWRFEDASRPLLLKAADNLPFSFVQVRSSTLENRAFLKDSDLHPIHGLKKGTLDKVSINA